MAGRVAEKFLQRDSLSAHEQQALGFELAGEGVHAGERFAAASALHLDRHGDLALAQDEVHLVIALAPVGQLDPSPDAGVEQVRAGGGFDEPPQ